MTEDLGIAPAFTSNRDDTLVGLNRVAKALCQNYPDHAGAMALGVCDCKYGASNVMALVRGLRAGDAHGQRHGEQTGCPELRTAMVLLSKMTPDEFTAIMDRSPTQ